MYLKDFTISNVFHAIEGMDFGEKDAILLFIGENDSINIHQLIQVLKEMKLPFLGGIFPGVIYQGKSFTEGGILTKVPLLAEPILIPHLSSTSYRLPPICSLLEEKSEKRTALILLDGLTSNISSFLTSMYNQLGDSISYIGGGAGSLSLVQRPSLFCKEGFFQDAALIALLDCQSSIGVRHGWKQIMGPFVATSTKDTRIFELNWNKAFPVYQKVVEEDFGQELNQENFFAIAKGYPFGIQKDYNECIVRDPIAVGQEGEIICVGEIPENTVLEILKGDGDSLKEAAILAAFDCQGVERKRILKGLIVDCISRALFLGDDFPAELAAVTEGLQSIYGEIQIEGILSLGEIASYGDGFLEFFNKTIVVGVLHE